MTDNEFSDIVTHIRDGYGIDLSQKRSFIENRLDNYLLSQCYNSYGEYLAQVKQDILGIEEQKMIDMLTVGHTYFLREPEHFEFFRDVILPEFKEKEAATKNLKIWCAGVSTGEEPYTAAMIIRDFLDKDYNSWDTGIMATDVSKRALEKAVKGIYSRQQIKGLPKKWVGRYFTKQNSRQYEIKQNIRKNVIFRQFNLKNPFPFKNKLHVIFLRNVLMYLDEETRQELGKQVCGFLEPGGYLITGMTETIDRDALGLEYLGNAIYRRPLV